MPRSVDLPRTTDVHTDLGAAETTDGPWKMPVVHGRGSTPAVAHHFWTTTVYHHGPRPRGSFRLASSEPDSAKLDIDLRAAIKSKNVTDSVAAARALVDQGHNFANLKSEKLGNSPLHIAASEGMTEVIAILAGKMDIDSTNKRGRSALSVAAMYGHLDAAKKLQEVGANINHTDFKLRTPLMTAVAYCHDDVALWLIGEGAKLDELGLEDQTALMAAAYRGRTTVLRAMLEKGADIHIADSDGRTALDWAQQVKAGEDEAVVKAKQEAAEILQEWNPNAQGG